MTLPFGPLLCDRLLVPPCLPRSLYPRKGTFTEDAVFLCVTDQSLHMLLDPSGKKSGSYRCSALLRVSGTSFHLWRLWLTSHIRSNFSSRSACAGLRFVPYPDSPGISPLFSHHLHQLQRIQSIWQALSSILDKDLPFDCAAVGQSTSSYTDAITWKVTTSYNAGGPNLTWLYRKS